RASRCAGILPVFSASALLAATSSAVGPSSDAAPASAAAAGGSAGVAPPAFLASALARASSARLRRCSGISVIESRPPLQRPGEAAVLPDPPEVDGHEDDDDEREHKHVQRVPAQQRVGADLLAAQQHEPHLG